MTGGMVTCEVPASGKEYGGELYDVGIASSCGAFGPNEDYCGATWDDRGDTVAVVLADGMGGEPHGRALSRLACLAALSAFRGGEDGEGAFFAAAQEVRAFLRETDNIKSGTTLLFAVVAPGSVRAWWAGDGLCLLLRHGGYMRLAKPERQDGTNLLKSFLGVRTGVSPSYREEALRPGDTLALVTDGVYEQLTDDAILKEMTQGSRSSHSAKRLVEAARRTGLDDATAAVVRMLC